MSVSSPVPEHENELMQAGKALQEQQVFLAHLPISGENVFGRESEVHLLNTAWKKKYPHIIVLTAFDGMGKTALVSHWVRQMQAEEYRGAERVLGWSFSAPKGAETSTDEFLVYALKSCGDPDPARGTPRNKGRRLAHAIRTQRTLLILDNVDALQYLDGKMQGSLKDPGLKVLLNELSRFNLGLCIITTSLAIKDFEDRNEIEVKQISLSSLSPETGAQLLETCGVQGPLDALKNVVRQFDGHPLTLTLLGGYLLFIHSGDVRKIDINPPLSTIESFEKHVRRIIDAFTIWLQRKPELNILFMMSLFDLLLETDAMNALSQKGILKVLLKPPVMKGLTEYLHECSAQEWQSAIKRLQRWHLLTEKTVLWDPPFGSDQEDNGPTEQGQVIDCHPLVREYFAEQLRKRLPNSWREAQNRLYDYYRHRIEKDFPDTLEEMQPLFAAIRHGCQAGRYEHVFREIYWRQIQRKDEDYCAKILGAPGAELSALAHFFTPAWEYPVEQLPDEVQARLLDIAALRLEEIGRLREAAELARKGMVFWNTQGNWEKAAQHANALSRLLLPSGKVEQAVVHAQLALQLAEYNEDRINSAIIRNGLVRALYLSGDLQEAEQVLQEAETMQQEQIQKSLFPIGPFTVFIYCDLLMHLGQYQEMQKWIARISDDGTQELSSLSRAIGKLLSGKALLFQLALLPREQGKLLLSPHRRESGSETPDQVRDLLNQAIETLRDIEELELLINGLLTRAVLCRISREFSVASADLEEARELAELGGMPLYLADYYLESAKLVYEQFAAERGRFSSDAVGEEFHQQMHDHVEVAEVLIWQTGYHLRDGDLEAVITLLKEAVPERVEEAEIAEQQLEQEIRRPVKQDQEIRWPVKQEQEIRRPAKQEQEIRWVEQQEQKIIRAGQYQNVYLYPGELYIAEMPTIVWTLLGSCISVVLYNKRLRFGAICHAQLPEERQQDGKCSDACVHPCYQNVPDSERFKYVTCSIRYMYDQFAARGIARDEITVKLFGGASVLNFLPETTNIGDENIEIARKVLQEYNLPIVRKDIGGRRGRTLYFYSDTGEVFMKKHRSKRKKSGWA